MIWRQTAPTVVPNSSAADTVGRNYLNRKSLSVVSQYGFVYLNDSGIHEITSVSMIPVVHSDTMSHSVSCFTTCDTLFHTVILYEMTYHVSFLSSSKLSAVLASLCATDEVRIRACSFARSLRSVAQCAGPDSNRRTPTGQRPKRCAFGLARQPARSLPYRSHPKIAVAPDRFAGGEVVPVSRDICIPRRLCWTLRPVTGCFRYGWASIRPLR